MRETKEECITFEGLRDAPYGASSELFHYGGSASILKHP